jgi:hypothetical protein
LDHHFQLAEEKSDPICSSAGCWRSKYSIERDAKKNSEVKYPYPVLDSDVKGTYQSEKLAEK